MDKNRWLCELPENPATRFWKVDFDELGRAEKVFVAIWELEAEVNNGGFSQYYSSHAGDNAQFVVSALEEIGAPETARIVRAANGKFPGKEPPATSADRQTILDQWEEEDKIAFFVLDDQFIGYPNDLTELLYAYLQDHKDQIVGLT